MSQYKKAILNIEKEAKLSGKILRPLSAKLLPQTKAEKSGLVNREKLLAINGRKRTMQLELAKKFNITYPTPAGGCLLCDKNYSIKLRDLFLYSKNPSSEEIQTLAGFRHFRSKGKIILGRKHEENLLLQELNKKLKYNIIIPSPLNPGPTALYESKQDKELAEQLVKAYSNADLKERDKFESLRLK
jgi:hypothetical protein